MDETSQNFPLVIPQNATVIKTLTYLDPDNIPVNLSGYTAKMDFRITVVSTGDPVINLTTENGGISINGTLGKVTFTITSTVTGNLENDQVLYYDLFIYSNTGVATRLLAGVATVSGSVTR